MERSLAEPTVAAADEAGGVVRARAREPGGGVTIWPGLAQALVHALGAALMGVIVAVRVRYSWRAM